MTPGIQSTSFGSITIEGQKYTNDVIIGLDGQIRKRNKRLSKEIYGTSHTISLAEAEYVYEAAAERLIVGGGMFNRIHLNPEAADFFSEKGIGVEILATSKALKLWNSTEGKVIGLFHITC